MKTTFWVLVLSLSLAVGAHAIPGFKVAKECKKGACRAAINRCVKEACASFPGSKSICKKAEKITLRIACTQVADHGQFCSELQSSGCTPN